MNTKIKIFIGSALGTVGSLLGLFAKAEYTTSTLATDISPILDETVQASISVAVSFLTANLPLIVVLGVAIGFTFWLIGKLRGALRGR